MEIIELNATEINKLSLELNGIEGRRNFYNEFHKDCLVSIIVMASNRLEKTKECLEALFKYTKDIPFELVLFDNGSTDDTLAYFESIKYEDKKIIHSTKNLGVAYAYNMGIKHSKGKYFVYLANDILVTKDWLKNLLICITSDSNIGVAVPYTSNTSNLQDPGFKYDSINEMFEIAENYNKSNPTLWEERMRITTSLPIFSREAVEQVGLFDMGFYHDFTEDDYCLRLRRAGWKLMVCGDTYACHNHVRLFNTKEEVEEVQSSMKMGRDYYFQKYGLDAWSDIMSPELQLVDLLNKITEYPKNNKILGIDIHSGDCLLNVKNTLRKKGIFNNELSIVNSEIKYYLENCSISSDVKIGSIEKDVNIASYSKKNIVVLGKCLNEYAEPIKVLSNLISILDSKGILLIKLKNSNTYETLFSGLGYANFRNQDMNVNLAFEDLVNCLNYMPIEKFEFSYSFGSKINEILPTIHEIFSKIGIDNEEAKAKLLINEYYFLIQKK
ncbi:MAG: glycosyltransferase family 2 protein [Erysipelotrichales bacterium]|nr:glycosyltransferase family 2 protein [Erysipelotrichales bacterium]